MFDQSQSPRLPLSAGLGYKPQHYTEIMQNAGPVSWFEVHAENYMGDGGRPLLIDSHGREIADPVWALLEYTLVRSGPRPLLVEWDNDVPDWPVLATEAARAKAALESIPA